MVDILKPLLTIEDDGGRGRHDAEMMRQVIVFERVQFEHMYCIAPGLAQTLQGWRLPIFALDAGGSREIENGRTSRKVESAYHIWNRFLLQLSSAPLQPTSPAIDSDNGQKCKNNEEYDSLNYVC